MSAITAYRHLEAIRHRLPEHPVCDVIAQSAKNILEIAEYYDAFLFDAFGVLNIGALPITGAIEAVAALRKQNKHLFVLSNAASVSKAHMVQRFQKLGFDFSATEIITSRDAVLEALKPFPEDMLWGLIGVEYGQEDLLAQHIRYITHEHRDFYHAPDGYLFLASMYWDDKKQQELVAALYKRPRPIVLGNPDLIAPMGGHSSIEPGSYVLLLEDHLFDHARVCGKPFPAIFNLAAKRLHHQGYDLKHQRTLMCGDTLHTDILGGNAFGIHTALLTGHGFFKGLDYQRYINESGIIPDWILPQL